MMKPNSARSRRFYVPLFADFHKKLTENEAAAWVRVPTSLLMRGEFATLSLQTRGVFVSIFLLCGLTAKAEITGNTRYLSNVLSCDERTLSKALKLLENSGLIFEIDREIEKKIESAAFDEKPAKGKTKRLKVDPNCSLCSGNGESLLGGKIVPCPRCEKTFR